MMIVESVLALATVVLVLAWLWSHGALRRGRDLPRRNGLHQTFARRCTARPIGWPIS